MTARTRYNLAPGPDGEVGDDAREFLRALAQKGDERFVDAEIHALIMFWIDDELPEADAVALTDLIAHVAVRSAQIRRARQGRLAS